MTNNTNGMFSDSQESTLLDDEMYKAIQRSIGHDILPIFTGSGNEELFNIPEERRDFIGNYDIIACIAGKKLAEQQAIEQEVEEKYHPIPDMLPDGQFDDTFPGSLNFYYTLADGNTGQDWVYSQTLEKVFIKMEKILPLRFTWDRAMEGLYLRTAMVFIPEQYRSDPVRRCHNHVATTNIINHNLGQHKIKHVVHCVNHSSTIYEEKNEHLSILTPLCNPEPGSQYVPMCFKFLCKNSCPSGMNRRPTELLFTLENQRNVVLGRRKLLVRVCSCPKRDKQKEETESTTPAKIRKVVPSAKKISSSSDKHVYKLELDVVGKENYLSVLKYAYDVMAGQAVRTGQFELYKPFMEEILMKTP